MKKLVSALISTALAVSTLSMGLVAGATDVTQVGAIGDKGVPDRFGGKEDALKTKYKEAYNWAITLHAHKSSDGLFDFGEASGELVHRWSGTDDSENAYEICNQDFDNGDSIASGAFTYNNWAALVCSDPDTMNVVVMRDAAAEWYAKGGGPNNRLSGNPTTNQYWRTEDGMQVAYQQFEKGYLRIEEGEAWYTYFHSPEVDGDAYVAPPKAPPAYGDIYAKNSDGCSWENPKYIPTDVPDDSSDPTDPTDPTQPGTGTGNGGGGNIVDPTISDPTVGGDDQTPDGQTPDGTNSTVEGAGSDTAGVNSGTVSGGNKNKNNNANANNDKTTGGANTVRKMNVGATVGIVAGCVVVLGGGAFCLYWFVLRKKKAAEGADEAAADVPQTEDKPEENPEDKK